MCGWRYHDVQAQRKTINGVLELGKAYRAYHFWIQKVHTRKGVHFLPFFSSVGPPGEIRLSYAVQCEETLCSWRCVGMIVVTHVLVNDPTRGYGVFIDNMLDAAA